MFDGIINEDLDVQNKYVDSYTKENHVMVNIIYSAEIIYDINPLPLDGFRY